MTFKPARNLANPHLQTLWPTFFRKQPAPLRRAEKMPLPDGDHLWLHWGSCKPDNGFAVVILHGITGSSDSPYCRGLQHQFEQQQIANVVVHSRGTANRPNDRAQLTYAGETADIHQALLYLEQQHAVRRVFIIGISLGGARLLNYLAGDNVSPLVQAAAAASVPLDLASSAERLNQGFSRLYRKHLLNELVTGMAQRIDHLSTIAPTEAEKLKALGPFNTLRTFEQYDSRVIAPLYGFRNAQHYYRECSPLGKLKKIDRPTLLIQAQDDPFLAPAALPSIDQTGNAVMLEVTRHGGHVGFISGSPRNPKYWLETRLLKQVLDFF